MSLSQSLSSISSSSSSSITSLLFEPNSNSLALTFSDSSISLYPSLSLSSSPLLSLSTTLISPPCSSSTFLVLPNNKVIFIVSSPHNYSPSQTLLRFFVLRNSQSFVKPNNVICTQKKHLCFDEKLGVLVNSRHGVSVRLSGSVNYFVMYSVSESEMLVFAVKEVDDQTLKLMRCAVIECCKLVWSVRVSTFGVLVIGEENGVWVVDLRSLVKGKGKGGRVKSKYVKLVDCGLSKNGEAASDVNGSRGSLEIHCTEEMEKTDVYAKLNPPFKGSCKRGGYYYFVPFKLKDTGKVSLVSVKAVSIQPLSPRRFLVLDSVGNLHLLCLSDHIINSISTCHMKQLSAAIKVQSLAAIPDTSITKERQTVAWVSDGGNSVHMLGLSDIDTTAADENIMNDSKELIHISVDQAIFTAEKVQDLVTFAADAILVLGQETLYAYSLS